MMYEKKKKEKKIEANQIPARKSKRNKRIKKKSNFTSLAKNRTRQPSHTLPHLSSPTSHLPAPTSHHSTTQHNTTQYIDTSTHPHIHAYTYSSQ
jgi:hypothetical protein